MNLSDKHINNGDHIIFGIKFTVKKNFDKLLVASRINSIIFIDRTNIIISTILKNNVSEAIIMTQLFS